MNLNEFIKDKLGSRCTDSVMKWLDDIDFYNCPAAKSHHGNFEGGLFNHSMMVAYELQRLTNLLNLTWEKPESPWIVGLPHDVCKTDDYDYDFSKSSEIRWNPSLNGHGDKSVLLISSHIELTDEEIACITYHMGAFTDQKEWSKYTDAVKRYPNVLFTHTADMIASQIKGV